MPEPEPNTELLDRELRRVINLLEESFGRIPSEDEVYNYVNGNHERRMTILRYAPRKES